MKIAHLHTFCQELEPALAFLTEGLKGELVERRLMMGTPGAVIRFDNMTVFLKEVGADWAPALAQDKICGFNHICFQVDDLNKTLEDVLALPGTKLAFEPYEIPGKNHRATFVIGPSNIYIELMEDVIKS